MVLSTLSIRSTESDREFVLSQYQNERMRVDLKGAAISAYADIWLYTDAPDLNSFIQQLGQFENPWQGERSWSSVEGDFSLSATCTSLGAVQFCIELQAAQGAPEEWRVKAGLVVEFGQLPQIAKKFNAFFTDAPP